MDWTEFFVSFPRKKVEVNVSRRELAAAALMELEVANAAGPTRHAFRLADLGDMPDEALGELIPQPSPERPAWEEAGFLCVRMPGREKPQHLLPLEEGVQFCFRQIDGVSSLSQIARRLGAKMGWEAQKAFGYVRGFFLSLVYYQVCLPRNPAAASSQPSAGDGEGQAG